MEEIEDDEIIHSQTEHAFRWERDLDEDFDNIDLETIIKIQNVYVRIKGVYEGLYKGFYRNTTLEQISDQDECLGYESYEALNVLAKAYFSIKEHGDHSHDMDALTSMVRIIVDNHSNCRVGNIIFDVSTLCFINECGPMKLVGNFATNWPEVVYAVNKMWTSILSGEYAENTLKNHYEYYYGLGEASGILVDDIIGFNPKDAFEENASVDGHSHFNDV